MFARVFDLAFALVYFRFLQEAGTGAYQFLVVFTTYLDTLLDFGLNTIMARDIARQHALADTAFRRVALLRLALWLVGLPIVALTFGPGRDLFNLPPEARLAGWLFYLALLPSILAKTATGLLWAFERLELTGLVSVLTTLLKTGIGIAVLLAGYGLIGLAGSSLAVNLVSATVLLLILRRVRPGATTEVSGAEANQVWDFRHLLVESWPLFLNQLLQGLFFKIDSMLLPLLAGLRPAGAYAAAYKVNEGLGVVSSSFTLALFPRLARQAGDNRLGQAYGQALKILLQIAFPLAAGTALLAEPIMTLVGGRAFLPDSATALMLLIWYLPFSYANGLTQYVLIALNRQRFLTGAFALAVVFNVAANALLIPRFGFVAAAWVTVGSEVVLLVPFLWAARAALHAVRPAGLLVPPLVATLVMAAAVWWVRDAMNPVLAILVGLLLYPAALWVLGGVDANERDLLRLLLGRGGAQPARA